MNLKITELIEADRLVIARVGGNGGRWSKGTNISVTRSEDGRYSIVTMVVILYCILGSCQVDRS